ncbi:MAG: helix-turn-helix transcriptional regulator, partial [bacterium]
QKNRTIKILEESNEKLKTLDEYSRSSMLSFIGTLESEIEEYEALKRGEFTLPKNISFVGLLKNIAKIRISKSLSQQDLAKMLRMTKQQVNRYEEHDYQNISMTKINEILDVLGISISLDLLEKVA